MDTPQAQHEKREATQDEVANLQHVADSVPAVVWVALVAGAAERFTFYAATTPWRKCQDSCQAVNSASPNLTLCRKLYTKWPRQSCCSGFFRTWSSNRDKYFQCIFFLLVFVAFAICHSLRCMARALQDVMSKLLVGAPYTPYTD